MLCWTRRARCLMTTASSGLEPSTCVSRSMEVQGTTKARELTLEKGALILKSDDKMSCPADSEIKLHYAFTRRAVALAFARIMTFQQHSAWETFLFESLHREVPPGYTRASLSQVVSCDKAAWARLATLNCQVREDDQGNFPLGEALLALRTDPSIALYLAPLAKPVQAVQSSSSARVSPYQPSTKPQKGKGKSAGKGKYYKTASNDPICLCLQYFFRLLPQCHCETG